MLGAGEIVGERSWACLGVGVDHTCTWKAAAAFGNYSSPVNIVKLAAD